MGRTRVPGNPGFAGQPRAEANCSLPGLCRKIWLWKVACPGGVRDLVGSGIDGPASLSATPWQAPFSPCGRERSLVEAVGIGTRRETAAHDRRRGVDGWRRRPVIGWFRRDAAAPGREQPTVRFPTPEPKMRIAARGRRTRLNWWRRWESNPRPRNSDRRFLRVQPAVKSHPMVGQQASFHTGQPEKSRSPGTGVQATQPI